MAGAYAFPSVREAVYGFLSEMMAPPVGGECIIWGNQNEISLPPGTNDYVIFTLLDSTRHGTNIESYDTSTEGLTLREGLEASVQIDCYAASVSGTDGSDAFSRAQSIELLFRDGAACRYFRENFPGVDPLYADPPHDTSAAGDAAGMVRRWTVIAHLWLSTAYSMRQPGFTNAQITFPNAVQTAATADAIAEAAGAVDEDNLPTDTAPGARSGHIGTFDVDTHVKEK